MNGSFDAGTTGWRTNNAATEKLDVQSKGGEVYARLRTTTTGSVTLNDVTNTVASAPRGATYHASVRVRATKPKVTGALRIREVGDTEVVHQASFTLSDTAWTTVALDLTTSQPGASLDVNVVAWSLPTSQNLLVDDVSLVQEIPELVVNGSFDGGTAGWRTNSTAEKFDVQTTGGDPYARLTTTSTTTIALNDVVNTVASAPVGTTYHASVRVRTTTPSVSGALRIREVGATVVTHQTSFTLNDTAWTPVEVDLTTTQPGASLDLNVIGWSLPSSKSLLVDDVSLMAASSMVVTSSVPGPAPAPDPTPTPTPDPTPTPTPAPDPTPTPTPAPDPTPTPTPAPDPTPTPTPAPDPTPTPTPTPTPDPTPAPDPTYRAGWTLVEDVNLSSSTGWSMDNGTASNTASQDLPQNVTFTSDGLRIVGKRETTPNGSAYSSGDAKGTGHAIPNYARVEVVGRGPAEAGLWPCVLWLRPLLGSDGEIDLMENFGGQPRVKATLHNEYGATHKMIGSSLAWSALSDPDAAALHTYVMEKTPNHIQIWVDGVELINVGPANAPDGFDWQRIFENPQQQWYPRVTLQIGCGTSNPTCATGTPSSSFSQTDMLVTELRIYRPAS